MRLREVLEIITESDRMELEKLIEQINPAKFVKNFTKFLAERGAGRFYFHIRLAGKLGITAFKTIAPAVEASLRSAKKRLTLRFRWQESQLSWFRASWFGSGFEDWCGWHNYF